MTKNLWKTLSINAKIFISFIAIILLGYGLTFFYIFKYENEILIKKEIHKLNIEAELTLKELKKYLLFLQKEIKFLSKLEIMDDIIANDIDKRITNILIKKASDLDNDIKLLALNTKGEIVSSSSAEKSPIKLIKKDKKIQIINNNYIINEKIYSSFNSSKVIGNLLLIYPIKNLSHHLKNKNGIYSWISSDCIEFEKPKINTEILEIKKSFFAPLDNLTLHYAVDKNIAFDTVYQVQKLLNKIFLVMIFFTSVFIIFISRNFVNPIKSLYKTAQYIINTGDYSKSIFIKSEDEIGKLTKIFNLLIQKTNNSLESLKEQSKKHEETLIDLIEFFNTITKTESKYDTIIVAVRELKRLTLAKEVFFTTDKKFFSNSVMLNIDVKDYKSNSIKHFGNIIIIHPLEPSSHQERFYNSISHMISLQIERISLMNEIKESLKTKSSFLSAMSHELKTPIGSILSIAQHLITSSNLNEDDIESVSKIEQAAYHLLQIINDILTIAKADSGKVELKIERAKLTQIINETLDILNPVAETKQLQIKNYIKNELTFNTDIKLFKMVLINIISNAIKYTPKGEISLQFQKTKNGYEIVVTDTGIGIDKEDLKYIFEEFYQGKNYKSGSGLGLSISKKYAKMLNGDISIYSEGIGKGTKVVFVFNSF